MTNLRREMPGIDSNEDLWPRLLAPTLELSLVAAWMAYTEAFASVVRRHGDDVYADVFLRARAAWLEALGVTA